MFVCAASKLLLNKKYFLINPYTSIHKCHPTFGDYTASISINVIESISVCYCLIVCD